MRIIIAAGGTGGHIIPAIAVADALKNKFGAEVIFIGVGKELEHKLIEGAGYRLEIVAVTPVVGGGLRGVIRLVGVMPGAFCKCRAIYKRERPDAVVGFGGYPSFSPIVTAWSMRVPRVLHEQNSAVGVANKFLARFCQRIFAAKDAQGFGSSASRVAYIGNPVRTEIQQIPIWAAPEAGQPFRILCLGGSQGAKTLNAAVVSMAANLKGRNVILVHQTGEADLENVQKFYMDSGMRFVEAVPFISDIAAQYAKAHLVISRAGAMSAAEIAAAKRPAIFVPLLIARSHQKQNIASLLNQGAAIMLEQNAELPDNLEKTVLSLLADIPKLSSMAEKARELAVSGGSPAADIIAEAVSRLANDSVRKQ